MVQDNDVVTLGHNGEIAIDNGWVHDLLREKPVNPVPQARFSFCGDKFFIARAVFASARLQSPLAHEGRSLIQEGRVVGQWEALHNAGSPEGWGRNDVVPGHL